MHLLAAAGAVLAQTDATEPTSLSQRRENLACTGVVDDEGGAPICRQVYEWTESALIASNVDLIVTAAVRSLVIVLLAFFVLRVLQGAIERFVKRMNDRSIEKLETMRRTGTVTDTAPISMARTQQRTETIGGVLNSSAKLVVWTVAGLMILGVFGFNLGPLIAGAGIAGVALGFGAQSLVRDFLTGTFMIMEDQFGVGDIVDVGEAVGTVDAISLRTTRIRSINGTMWHVPNGEITRVGNMSQLWSRALLDIGVAYATNVPEACAIMKRVADEMAAEEEWSDFFFEPAEVWGVQDLADNEVTIRMVAKVTPAKQWPIERQLRARIKHAFDEAGISIPFPQREIWIRQESADALGVAAPGPQASGEGPSTASSQRGDADLGDPTEPAQGGAARPEVSPWLGTERGADRP